MATTSSILLNEFKSITFDDIWDILRTLQSIKEVASFLLLIWFDLFHMKIVIPSKMLEK